MRAVRTMRRAPAAVTLFIVASSMPAAAQPSTLKETVVVTATVAPESLGNIGRPVAIVTGEELRTLPLGSLADALRLMSSVEVRSRGRAGLYVQVTNLFDRDYEEIRGVEMPGRWVKAGVRLR